MVDRQTPLPHGATYGPGAVVTSPLSEYRDVPAVLPGVVALVHEAGNPYLDWLFGGRERASGAIAAWMLRPDSELSIDRVRIALVGDELAGTYISLAGSELRTCRQADALALIAETGQSQAARAALVERLTASKELFPPVRPDDFYLSKIGVVGKHRRKGLGRALTHEFLAAGREAGCRQFRLDVAADNEPAVRLYRSLGFHTESKREAAGLRYLAMTAAPNRIASPGGPP